MKSKSLSDVSHVLVCGGKSCKKDSKGLRKALAAAAEGTNGAILVLKTPCLGCCEEGPVAVVWPKGVCFLNAAASDVPEILVATGWVIPEEGGPDTGKPAENTAKKPGAVKAKKNRAMRKRSE